MAEIEKKQPPVPVPPAKKKSTGQSYVPVQHQAPQKPAEPVERLELPGNPPALLERIWGDLSGFERDVLFPHLVGHTSAEWVAHTLTENGYKISATSIRAYRRSLSSE